MPDPRNQRSRTKERQTRLQEQHQRELRRAQRKRAAIGISMVVVIMAVLTGVLIQATRGTSSVATGTTSSTVGNPLEELNPSSTASLPDGPPASLPPPVTGASVTGATACPAADGSSPRVTSFAEAPPMCIDVNATYEATMNTSVGAIKFLLNPEQTPSGVNAIVVLAGYHYWDGVPITSIKPGTVFQLGNPNQAGPGFTVPNETPAVGAIYPIGTPALIAGTGATIDPGTFQVAIGEQAADLPKNTPAFGLMLDGLATLQAIRKAGSQSGAPTQVITIESLTVVQSPPSTATSTTAAAG